MSSYIPNSPFARTLLILSLGAANAVLAQTDPVSSPGGAIEQLETMVITGSRIARRDAEAVGPMTTLTNSDIKFTAPTSVGDLLQSLPSVGVSLNSNGTQGTAFGVSSIGLRYLGSTEGSGNRTLVLVDGHRWVNAAGGRGFRDFVDLNTIPLGMIDRIEVLKDGASAIYGADAIAGVVNIFTKKSLEGFEASLRLGETSHKDNENYSGYLNWGKSFERGSLFLSGSYNNTKPILTEDRPLTKEALAPLTAPPTSPQGIYVLPGLSNNAFFGTPTGFAQNAANAITRNNGITTIGSGTAADNSFHVAQLPADFYNTQAQGIYSAGPSKRSALFGRVTYELTDSITGHVEALYSHRESSQLFAPFPLDIRGSNGFSISRDQAFNPFGTANGIPLANALAFSGNTFRIQRVPIEVGNRNNIQKVDTYRLAAGLEGEANLFGTWKWDTFASYSRTKATFDAVNQINLDNVYRALASPAVCAAAPGCVPLDIFGTITPAMAEYIRYNGHDVTGTRQFDFTINASRELFALPGGPLGLATGYEYRRESAYDFPDAFAATGSTVLPAIAGVAQSPTTAQSRDVTIGSYSLQEVYLELSAPLLAKLPAIDKLELNAAVRYSDYSTVSGKATTKFGILYRPVNPVLIRATYAQGFRAPSILELYQGQRQTNFQTIDPCNGGGAGLIGCAGVPANYNQALFNGGLTRGITAGNGNLKAETSDTYSLGISFTPKSLPGFSATIDTFKIKLKDAIAAQSGTQILQTCANTGSLCNLVQRASTGEVLQLTQAVVNLARIEVAGTDATVRYVFPVGAAKIDSSIDVSYLQKYRTFTPQPNGSVLIDDRAGKSDQPRTTFPHWKGQAAVRYIARDYSAGWKTRYIGASDDLPNNAVNGGRVSAVYYHDAQFGYTFPGTEIKLTLGIDNVFDRQPPASAANNPINFDIYTYDVRGRYFYLSATTKF